MVHLLAKLGVDPDRLAAIGFGQYRPVADNRTETGRQKNRRVTLIILANNRTREEMDLRPRGGRSAALSQGKAAL